jgi:protein O-GlcNAc transferase
MNELLFQSAVRAHQAGNLAEAARLYGEVLRADPENCDVLCMLGALNAHRGQVQEANRLADDLVRREIRTGRSLYNVGCLLQKLQRHKEATEIFSKALTLGHDRFATLINSSLSLSELERHEDALDAIDRALEIHPNEAGAWNNRGNELLRVQRYDEALASYDKALSIKPNYADAWESRGNALRGLNRHEDALESYDKALQIRPNRASIWSKRGDLMYALERHEEALAGYDKSLSITPHDAGALIKRGLTLMWLERHKEAVVSFDNALAIDPNNAHAFSFRGNAHNELKYYADALISFDQSLAIDPTSPDALVGRARALSGLMNFDEAITSYDKILALRPDCIEAMVNRGSALAALKRYEEAIADCESVLVLNPDQEYVRGYLLFYKLSSCDWHALEADREAIAAGLQAGKRVIQPFVNLIVAQSPAEQLQCARIWTADKYSSSTAPLWRGERYGHDRIRVAYLSADFRWHAIAALMAGVFEHHDRSRFEISAISFGPDDGSELRGRLVHAFDRFIDVRDKNDSEVASLLRDMETDIAVDLMGLTNHSRPSILAQRSAPVQVNYLGYPATMGADFYDYILADRIVIPEEQQRFYGERVVYLPDSYQCNDSKRRIAERPPSRAEAGLPETGFVFCSFNNNNKVTPEIFSIWMRLLHAVERSVLWLFEDNEAAARNLRREAEARGIAADRLVFAPKKNMDEHLARHRLADLFLDTLPFCAHTTASDALWAGLPVLTCIGSTFAGRVAASLLYAVGLPGMVTQTLADYEALALKLAHDPSMLSSVKATLARNRNNHPAFDTARFTRHLESAYTKMWERYQRGDAPASFGIGGPSISISPS